MLKRVLLSVVTLIAVRGFAEQAPVVRSPQAPLPEPTLDAPKPKMASLSSAEQTAQVDEYLVKIREILARIEQLAQIARRSKDIIRLNCVNDKLIQARGHLNLAEGAARKFREALSRRDEEARQHEFSRLTIVHQKMLAINQEAENCVGEELSYVADTMVEFSIDPSITQEDPTQTPVQEPIVERPPTASPYN